VIAAASPAASPDALAAIWRNVPESFLDLFWASGTSPESEDLASRLRRFGSSLTGAVLIPRSVLAEVARELHPGDPCIGALRRLLAGEALGLLGNLIFGFDDRLHPCVGLGGERHELLALLERLRRLADETIPVLLTGETGTGKEIVARALHRLGRRRARPWMAINCAELHESILESELFGHARGSFTGAAVDRAGLLESAADGTAFLDEIGELPPSAQAKLLRVLEEHRVRRLGSSQSRALHCRILAATNRNLTAEIDRGRFRADLFYRLRGAEISLVPLRTRPRDILPLAEAFLTRAALRFRRRCLGLSEEAKLALLAHAWPGNVRELRQVLEAAVLAAEGEWVQLGDLSIAAPRTNMPVRETPFSVHAVERATIVRALETTAGNKVAAARLLGLTRQSLQRRIERHRIALPAGNGRSGPESAVTQSL
ncbi:MAG: sigma 54-interacting transcriptional regulator, partial [Candidatus Binatia bacterium]